MSEIEHVSDTAFMVAVFRAQESERPDALFRDPLAARLAGEHGRRIVAALPRRAFMGGWSVVIRTCLIDDYLRAAIAEGADLILNLGAGLDTRPYRMDLPATLRWVEVDYPHVIQLKEARLAGESPRCQLERVAIDLADAPTRARFLADTAARSKNILVLTEGVVPYLSPEEVGALADLLRQHPSYRRWIVDYFSPESYRYRERSGMKRVLKNAPFRFEPTDYFGFFKQHGWQPKTLRYLVPEGEARKRPFPAPPYVRLWMRLLRPLMSQARLDTMRQFSGYVLFEPTRG
jgi:methyltransferase (TIGR00027 family)